jgi:biopolymer transport protein ExbB
MLANIVVEKFIEGGPIMWPILLTAIVAVAVIGERIVVDARSLSTRSQTAEKGLAALERDSRRRGSRKAPVIRLFA